MNVFIDCGTNEGQGLNAIYKLESMDDSWKVIGFEPDPNCLYEDRIQHIKNVTINKSAVFDYDGIIEFSQMLENTEGSGVLGMMSEGACADPTSQSYRKNNSIIKVPCADLSRIILEHKDCEFIVVKLDVEGSEFTILNKLIETNAIQYINALYVEWHHAYVKGQSKETVNLLKRRIIEKNSFIRMYDWH